MVISVLASQNPFGGGESGSRQSVRALRVASGPLYLQPTRLWNIRDEVL